MTFREYAMDYCRERGMFPHQAAEVARRVATSPANEPMWSRMDESVDGYPPDVLVVFDMVIDAEASAYIDDECPEAWFRPLFVSADS